VPAGWDAVQSRAQIARLTSKSGEIRRGVEPFGRRPAPTTQDRAREVGIASSCEPGARQGAARPDFGPFVPLALRAQYAPLGSPLHATADHPALLDALDAAFAGWEAAASELRPPLRLALRTGVALRGADAPQFAADADRLRIEGAGVQAVADARQGSASATVSPELARDAAALRAHVIEPLALFLLTAAGRAPIHAAGVVVGDVALLLAGPSGSGKSCLALAAHEMGLGVLTDDIVYLQTRPMLRAWGLPRPVHVYARDSAARTGAVRIRNGKAKRAIPLAAFAPAPASRVALVLIEPGRDVALRPIVGVEALAAFAALEPGFDLRRDAILDTVARVSAGGAWRLTLSADPREAIALLIRRLPAIRAGSAA
jgi:hypothetical protein